MKSEKSVKFVKSMENKLNNELIVKNWSKNRLLPAKIPAGLKQF